MAMFGAIYHIAPKLMGQEWPSLGLVKLHFWTSAVGTAVIVFCFSLAGWRIGADLLQPAMPFLKAVNGQIPLLVTGMVGSVLILAGNVALLVNLFGLAARSCRMCCAGGSSPCALPTTEVAR